MANGHSPNSPKGQGSMGPVHTQKPKTSSNTNSKPGKSVVTKGKRVPGI